MASNYTMTVFLGAGEEGKTTYETILKICEKKQKGFSQYVRELIRKDIDDKSTEKKK